MKHNRCRRPVKPRVSPSVLERINPNVAGIDCGSAEHFVAVPPDRDPSPVRSFQTFTSDLQRARGLADHVPRDERGGRLRFTLHLGRAFLPAGPVQSYAKTGDTEKAIEHLLTYLRQKPDELACGGCSTSRT